MLEGKAQCFHGIHHISIVTLIIDSGTLKYIDKVCLVIIKSFSFRSRNKNGAAQKTFIP